MVRNTALFNRVGRRCYRPPLGEVPQTVRPFVRNKEDCAIATMTKCSHALFDETKKQVAPLGVSNS